MEINILFLDVDGVLNFSSSDNEFESICLTNLSNFIKKNNSKIIITSTYRLEDTSLNRLWNEIQKYNIDLNYCLLENYKCTPDFQTSRAREICHVLNQINNDKDFSLKSFVIFDDCNFLIDEDISIINTLSKNFILVNNKLGLTSDDVLKANFIIDNLLL